MVIEEPRDSQYQKLISEFPLTPIADHRAYQRAIEVLDRLFEMDSVQSAGEREFFQALALLAYEYEEAIRASRTRDFLDTHTESHANQLEFVDLPYETSPESR